MRKVVVFAALALCAAQSFAETHTVTFRRMNGTVLSKVEVAHGANATSLVPAGPDESAHDLSFSRWDLVDKLACVTNDVTCWALYEATTAKSPSTSIASKSVAARDLPYSIDEYFQMYDNLAWSDEFSGSELSISSGSGWWWSTGGKNWQYETGQPDGDSQVFVKGNQEVSDGTLKIICKREATNRVTSAMINSKSRVEFKLGRCEIRAKLTNVVGANTAFWMMGSTGDWPACGEFDVFEHMNGNDAFGSTYHLPNPDNVAPTIMNSVTGMTEDGTRWGDCFHRIGAILSDHECVWYVDDHIYQRIDIRDPRFEMVRDRSWYVILNYAFCTRLSGITDLTDARVVNFMRDVYEIDYCRIFTNTNAGNTVARKAEPDGARLSGPVKATVWRGWQMNWAKQGSNYYMDHLTGRESSHIRKALREYFGRDKTDVLVFLTTPTHQTSGVSPDAAFDVPGYSAVFASPDGEDKNDYHGDQRTKMLGGIMFNKDRFSVHDSSVGAFSLSGDFNFTNCSAMVSELVEKDTGAKVKVVGVNMLSTNMVGVSGSVAAHGMSALFAKLNAMKDEKVILLLQGDGWANWNYLDNRVKTELKPSFTRLGQFTSFWPTYQSAWVTSNYTASAENPAPLTLNTSNVYTNQAYCATVQFEAPAQDPVDPDRILYVPVAAGATNTLDAALVTEYITNIVKQGSGTLVASAIPDYTGTITVEGGVWQGGANAGDFGTDGVVIDVKSGASLALRGATTNGLASAVLSGKTVNLYGAKEANTRGKIYVYNDATTTLGPNVTIRLKDADSVLYLDCASWRAFYISSGTIDLGGRKLSVSSNYRRFETGATVVNGGTLELDHTEFNVDNDSRIPTFSGTGTLKTNYAINLKKLVSAPGWTLSGNQVSLHGNINRKPTTTDYPVWSGPVAFSGSSKLAEYAGASSGTSNTVFNLKGAVSGSGSLLIGPGWLNLHSAANSYTGKVTVTGQAVGAVQPILAGGGGIGLWSGAACFPNASSVTFTNTARLAFMDNTVCTVPNVKFIALEGETQSISGGVHTARSTMAGFVKEGAGTLVVDSPAQITGLGDVKGGTLKVAYRSDTSAQTQEAMLEPMPQFSRLRFASGTKLDLSDNVGMVLNDLEGSPVVTNSGMFGISGKWKLVAPGGKLDIVGQNAMGGQAAGVLCFLPGATFDLADEAAFRTAVAAAGPDGLLVAEANWILDPSNEQLQGSVALPSPAQSLGAGWSMSIGKGRGDDYAGRGLYLRYSDPSASGYAAWIAGKGITGAAAASDKVTNGIANGVRYAFDIDPATSEIGTPIIQVVRDAAGNPSVQSRDLATGRDDVTFGILATSDLGNWKSATLIPMEKSATDGLWKPSASKKSGYSYPAQMFFKYTVEVK